MIRFTRGNLLESNADALVNTVNEVGVMGKGIALMFRDAFPHNTEEYERAAKANEVAVGKMLLTENPVLAGPRWIVNFPTKKHWRQQSRLQWIRDGLTDLVRVIEDNDIKSIALPPLGCGNGGLAWAEVRSEIVGALGALEGVDVIVYEPTAEYQGKPKQSGVERLTPARALIAELVRRYGALGLDCTILEVQKLAWFLSREINRQALSDPLRLTFRADKYGPYDDKLRHLLDALDGSYLHSAKRLADASPYDLIWFDPDRQEQLARYLQSSEMSAYLSSLDVTEALIDGFQSPFGMELLATVDWLIEREDVLPEVRELKDGLWKWPGGREAGSRKSAIFDERALTIALARVAAEHRPSTGFLFV